MAGSAIRLVDSAAGVGLISRVRTGSRWLLPRSCASAQRKGSD